METLSTTVSIGERKAILRNCPLCGTSSSSATRSKYSDSIWHMNECAECNFIYLVAAPIYKELVSEFSWEKTAADRQVKRKDKFPIMYWLSKKTRWRLHIIKKKQVEHLLMQYVTSGSVVDIGCGKGDQLKRLPAPYVPYGIEISEAEASYAVTHAESRNGGIVNKSALEGLKTFPENFASGVIMRSYLEHEAYPREVLEETYRVLDHNGVAIIKVPNYGCLNRIVLSDKWSGFRFPDHLNYFTPHTLRTMCENAGFTVRRFGVMDKLPFSDNMWLVAGKQ